MLPATLNSSFTLLFAREDAVAQCFVEKRGIHQGCRTELRVIRHNIDVVEW